MDAKLPNVSMGDSNSYACFAYVDELALTWFTDEVNLKIALLVGGDSCLYLAHPKGNIENNYQVR